MQDVVTWDELNTENINVIYCEGGILSSFGDAATGRRVWKIKRQYIEEFLTNGGILIVADVDWNFASLFCDDDFRKIFWTNFVYGNTTGQPYRSIWWTGLGVKTQSGVALEWMLQKW
jgi:hypothetical protein